VYGEQPETLSQVDEDYEAHAGLSPYGKAKRAAETLCQLSPVHFVIARCFAFVGPHLPMDKNFAIGNFIRNADRGEPIQIRGDGKTLRSYLYASELAIALWTVLLHGQIGRAYNVGSEDSFTIKEVAEFVAAIFGHVEIVVEGGRDFGARRYVPSIARLREELKFQQRITLTNALERTKRWLEAAL
jgi:dTDP-glucose 4,6-dehydratase